MDLDITDADLIEHLQYQVSQQQKPKVKRLANPEKLPRYLLLKNQRLSLQQQYQIISMRYLQIGSDILKYPAVTIKSIAAKVGAKYSTVCNFLKRYQ